MSSDVARILRVEGLAFFGRITAGQSHEVTNVLNIINELAGLQADLLQARSDERPVNLDKLEGIAKKLQAQVSRGESIIKNINRFAHSVDAPISVFDLHELLARMLFLAERTTRLSEIELVAELPSETIVLENNPFYLQQAVFACIEAGVCAASEKRRITVMYRLAHGGVEIVVTSADPVPASTAVAVKMRLLELLLVEIGGELRESSEHRIGFFVPAHRSE